MEVLNSNGLAGPIEVAPVILLDAGVKLISTREDQAFAARSLPSLPEGCDSAFKDCTGIIVQRNCTCVARFRAFVGNPGIPLCQIDLWRRKGKELAFAKTSRYSDNGRILHPGAAHRFYQGG